jgi:hypothetical protein
VAYNSSKPVFPGLTAPCELHHAGHNLSFIGFALPRRIGHEAARANKLHGG